MIRKTDGYSLFSSKGRKLGTYPTKEGVRHRERQVIMFRTLKKLKKQGRRRPTWLRGEKVWEKV